MRYADDTTFIADFEIRLQILLNTVGAERKTNDLLLTVKNGCK